MAGKRDAQNRNSIIERRPCSNTRFANSPQKKVCLCLKHVVTLEVEWHTVHDDCLLPWPLQLHRARQVVPRDYTSGPNDFHASTISRTQIVKMDLGKYSSGTTKTDLCNRLRFHLKRGFGGGHGDNFLNFAHQPTNDIEFVYQVEDDTPALCTLRAVTSAIVHPRAPLTEVLPHRRPN